MREDDPAQAAGAPRGETFGTRLRRLRKERRISLIGMARLVDAAKPTVWKWESDKARPRPEMLEALALALDVSEQMLLTGRDDAAPPMSLGDVIKDCKARIAAAAGTTADKVSITIQV
ncbi:helix-turn-helix domain-containing protein [Altererythrobacter soli]|uniref:Helix-turn-helix domain-containing protein n=1 Tax=Croceibacterium soli TaxID=1739690 RepID=A0A6I4UP79_9SPHN|nr:helix-turn-helix domain-containing protein [Croceibacterium soli]MXP40562.1 helix-turn-helix domain-containing protein [Croceibacterium soli]